MTLLIVKVRLGCQGDFLRWYTMQFSVLGSLTYKYILGIDVLQCLNASLDTSQTRVSMWISKDGVTFYLPQVLK